MKLMTDQNIDFLPVFVNYGQLNLEREFQSLNKGCAWLSCRPPLVVSIAGFGQAVSSGLTNAKLDIVRDAFTPNRNLLFIILAASVAYQRNVSQIVMGLLSESSAIFPDQTDKFIAVASEAISTSLSVQMSVVLPLRDMRKPDVKSMAERLGVPHYYSCHAGGEQPCGACIACLEYA